VSNGGRTSWISASHVSLEPPPRASGHRNHATRSTSHWHSANPHKRSRNSNGYFSAGACPCSGSNICIGPRGGRFCITSGGNKRYGV
jgi:hypothetical protein